MIAAVGGVFAAGLLFSIVSTVAHQRKIYDGYTTRLPDAPGVLLETNPSFTADSVLFTGLLPDGYAHGEIKTVAFG